MSEEFDPVLQASNIAKTVGREIEIKYAKGQKEHGGNFFAKPTVLNVREEALDLISYTHVLADHQIKLIEHLQRMLAQARQLDVHISLIENLKEAINLAANL
jgi:ribonuclease BN (tRNA processing enzyme)